MTDRTHVIGEWTREELAAELTNFQNVAALTLPRKGNFPRLPNIDYFAATEPYKGCVGGDYLAIVNFDRYRLKEKIKAAREGNNPVLAENLAMNINTVGIAVGDAAGHMITDNTIINWLDGAFKAGVALQLKYEGRITRDLFEMLNTMLYNHMKPDFLRRKPFITLLYGEVHNDGRIRYLSAGHPCPMVFSRQYEKIERLDGAHTKTSTPLGVIPSQSHVDYEHFDDDATIVKDRYAVNEIRLLGQGDIMLLYTDGITELRGGRANFCDARLEEVLRAVKDAPAREIYSAIMKDVRAFAPITDDITLAVVKTV